MEKILGFLLGVIIGLCIMIPVINLKKDYDKLKKENDNLKQEIIDYKWQIEQVPYIIDYWCQGE